MRACPRCFSVYQTEPEHCSFDGEKLSAAADPLLGKMLSRFRLDRLLGVGGTGCVYLGTVSDTQRPCAIKLLFREMAADKSIAQRFRREAEAVRRIQHPNVVSIIDYGTTPAGLIYLVMEHLEGRTLKEQLEEQAPFPPALANRILQQLASGLAEAHRVGYVHRDLKPGNVIISGAPGAERVKILDFGIVASLHERSADERLTKTGYIVGTPTYMAPEQIDPKAVAPQIDVYALGVILYEMLSGAPPFSGSLEQILVGKMTQSPAPLPDAGELGRLALRMLESDPARRPASALQVLAELNRAFLTNDDPQTVRAPMPELEPLAQVGFQVATIRVFDPYFEAEEAPEAEASAGLRPASSASGWYGGPEPQAKPRHDTLVLDPVYAAAGPTPTSPGGAGVSEDAVMEAPTRIGPMPPSEADTGENQNEEVDDDQLMTTEGPAPFEVQALVLAAQHTALASGDNEGPTFDSQSAEFYADTMLSQVPEGETPDLAHTQDAWSPPPLRFPQSEPLSPGEPLDPTRPSIPSPKVEPRPPPTRETKRLFLALAFGAVLMLAAGVAYLMMARYTVIIDVPPGTPKS